MNALCVQSHELIPRIRGALAGSPLVGGLVHDNAWGSNPWGGKRSLRGALFMNNKVYDEGAVGCIMKGSLQVAAKTCYKPDHLCRSLHCCICHLVADWFLAMPVAQDFFSRLKRSPGSEPLGKTTVKHASLKVGL